MTEKENYPPLRKMSIAEQYEFYKEITEQEIEKIRKENKALQERNVILRGLVDKQQAEFERFKEIETTVNGFWGELQKLAMFKDKETPTLEELLEYMENLKAEAIKECLGKLKEFMHNKFKSLDEYEFEYVTERDIDNFTKEMEREGK